MDYVSIGERIKALRKQKNVTQEELGKALHLSRPAEQRREKGEALTPDEILTICNFFNVSADWLLGRPDSIQNPKPDIQVACKTLGITEAAANNLIAANGALNELLSDSELTRRVGTLCEQYTFYSRMANNDDSVLDDDIIKTPKGYVFVGPGSWAMELAHTIGVCFERRLLEKLENGEVQ